MPDRIYAPNVHLFAYHLKPTITDTSSPDLRELFDKGESILKKFGIDAAIPVCDRPGYQVKLLPDNPDGDAAVAFERSSDPPLTGIAYPVRIHDTYALALNVRRPEQDPSGAKTDPVDVSFFQQLHPHHCWQNDSHLPSLGQTLLLTAWYTPEKTWQLWRLRENQKDLKHLADRCLSAFWGNADGLPPFFQRGELFGSPIYEYGIPYEPAAYQHILVWIFCTPETDTKLQEQYLNLVDLFCYRNKIIKAYQNSRILHSVSAQALQKLEGIFSLPENLLERDSLRPQDLKALKQHIKRLPEEEFEYERQLQELGNCRQTIEVNARNYQRELDLIRTQLPDDDIAVLVNFADSYRLFQEQIELDLGYLNQGLGLLDRAIALIRGRVEIEQAERDKALQDTIAMVGLGVSFAGIGGVAAPYLIPPPSQKSTLPLLSLNPLHPATAVIVLCLCSGLIGVVLGLAIAKFAQFLSARNSD